MPCDAFPKNTRVDPDGMLSIDSYSTLEEAKKELLNAEWIRRRQKEDRTLVHVSRHRVKKLSNV